jgi:thymidylate synthase
VIKLINTTFIKARDLPDLWFQAIHDILDNGRRFVVNRGSYEGQTRLEYDYFIGHVKYPGTRPLIPDIPPSCGIPNPVDEGYIYGGEGYERSYVEYLMTSEKAKGESYTYGSRMCEASLLGEKLTWFKEINKEIISEFKVDGKCLFEKDGKIYLNQIEWVIDIYRKYGYNNNQMILQIGEPTDLLLLDPPCLRQIGCKILDNKLNFFVNFRSWELFNGLPANLAGIQILKEYMSSEIGVDDGVMIVESKGLHLYGYAENLAKLRCMKDLED